MIMQNNTGKRNPCSRYFVINLQAPYTVGTLWINVT